MGLFVAFAIIALLGLMAYIRLAPSDPALWHVNLHENRPEALRYTLMPPGTDPVRPLTGGAYADLFMMQAEARQTLIRLNTIALADPRTMLFAGSPEAGHVTWITRSALWGFPDYTTAQVTPSGLTLYGRLRFGRSDLGVNAARLRDWLSRL